MIELLTAEQGVAFGVSPTTELRRYLMMGTGQTHYETAAQQYDRFKNALRESLDEAYDAKEVVDLIVECRTLAPKPETCIHALAHVLSTKDKSLRDVRDYAWSKLRRIVTNGSHMLTFAAVLDAHRGWGRAVQRNIGEWYTGLGDNLAFQLTKYDGRTIPNHGRWEQRDVLALAFGLTKTGKLTPKPKFTLPNEDTFEVLQYTHGDVDLRPESRTANVEYIRAVRSLPDMGENELAATVTSYRMPWEVVPTDKRTAKVWASLIPHMGGTAFYRNMGVFAASGVDPLVVLEKLQTAREHPLNILTAWYVYRMGHGIRSALTWKPDSRILEALEEAFYNAFLYTAPTNIPQLVALDVSSSMKQPTFNGVEGLHARTVSAVLAMTVARTETEVPPEFVAFSTNLVDFPLSKEDSLESVIRTMERIKFGNTHTSLPLQMMLDEQKEYAGYTVYTDVQTFDRDTPTLLAKVRQRTPMKMIEVNMAANQFTFASMPLDLTVTGFSSDMPAIVNTFLSL